MKKIKEAIINKFESLGRIKLKTVILLLVFVSIGYLILVSSLYAAVPQRINYQGKLLDSGGEPVSNGNRNITFRIFNVSTLGVALWSETQSVNTQDGLFNVILGSISSINLDFNQDYWLEVQVSGDGAMTPRHRLVSVPYSFRAEDANNSEQLNSQSAGYYLNASNINAGSLSDARLSSNVTKLGQTIEVNEIYPNIVSSVDGVTNDGGNIDLVAGSNISIIPNDGANNITISASASGDNLGNHIATQNLRLNGHYLSGDGDSEGVYVNSIGEVGIGMAPVAQYSLSLDAGVYTNRVKIDNSVQPWIWLDDSTKNWFILIQDSNFLVNENNNSVPNSTRLAVIPGGNVGIGTITPTRRLWVNGDAGGTTAWSNDSHSSYKEKFKNVTVLDKIKSLNIKEWQYKKEHCLQDTYRHLSPFAEDFRAEFGLGKSEREIQALDVAGVALKAIQELQSINERLLQRISESERKIKQLERQK